VLDKLFGVFYRVDQSRNTRDDGLGLAISQKTVNHIGGSMRAALPERGLSISVYLPLADKTLL
jgi:signal transduction histidine kinase